MSERPPQDNFSPDPQQALAQIRADIDGLTREYAQGKLNAAQFNALYKHYTDKRTLIQRLIERNPQGDAWRAAAERGHTAMLRDQLEARALYYVVFRRGERRPLLAQGKISQQAAQRMHSLLQVLWAMQNWRRGLAQKAIGNEAWLLLVTGDDAFTLVLYFLQPSAWQMNHLRELHDDFERANRVALVRGLPPERMVFPQRALLE